MHAEFSWKKFTFDFSRVKKDSFKTSLSNTKYQQNVQIANIEYREHYCLFKALGPKATH